MPTTAHFSTAHHADTGMRLVARAGITITTIITTTTPHGGASG